jgi:A/G-specific adenine glycosylase
MSKDFSSKLLRWQEENPRHLPWKASKNPYYIWLSEIILQQTRVEQGTPYYLKFITNYPKVSDLANATEQQVLKDWEGLGYYSRARNLHASAKYIHNELNDQFPQSYEEIIKLKGVGSYTAAAIASFAYDLPHAVVDGNVYRVLSRIFGIHLPIDSTEGKKFFQNKADELLPMDQAAAFNQAIMNFGATHCKPKLPLCSNCPFAEHCVAYNEDIISELPKKKNKLSKKARHFNYLVYTDSESIKIIERKSKDIWQNLFEFPMLETKAPVDEEQLKELLTNKKLLQKEIGINYIDGGKQTLSHQIIHAKFFKIELKTSNSPFNIEGSEFVSFRDLTTFAFPVVIREFIERNIYQGSILL